MQDTEELLISIKDACSKIPASRRLLDSQYNPLQENAFTLDVVQLISRLGVLALGTRDSHGGNDRKTHTLFEISQHKHWVPTLYFLCPTCISSESK